MLPSVYVVFTLTVQSLGKCVSKGPVYNSGKKRKKGKMKQNWEEKKTNSVAKLLKRKISDWESVHDDNIAVDDDTDTSLHDWAERKCG